MQLLSVLALDLALHLALALKLVLALALGRVLKRFDVPPEASSRDSCLGTAAARAARKKVQM